MVARLTRDPAKSIPPFRRSTRTEWTLGSAIEVRRVPGFDYQLHLPRPGNVTTPVVVVAADSVESRDLSLRDVPGEMQWLRHRTAFPSVGRRCL
jgi:hypothetical protein